jgi:hypothetical protein
MTQRIMITPVHTAHVASSGLKLEEFVSDTPWSEADHVDLHQASAIDGVSITPLPVNSDGRGALSELLTTRRGPIEPIVHIYQVTALAGSIRAWVYHEHQSDRLAFCNGQFEIALYDIRPASPDHQPACRLQAWPRTAGVVANSTARHTRRLQPRQRDVDLREHADPCLRSSCAGQAPFALRRPESPLPV